MRKLACNFFPFLSCRYREWGWKIFQAFEQYTRVGKLEGAPPLSDVTPRPTKPKGQDGDFFLGETLKTSSYCLRRKPFYL